MKNENNSFNFISTAIKYVLSVKIIIGFILIFVGLYAAINIVIIVYNIFMDISNVPFLKHTVELITRSVKIVGDSKDGLFVSDSFLSYGIAIILLLFLGGVTTKIIKTGADMISKLEIKYLYEKMWAEWQEEKKNKKEVPEENFDNLFNKEHNK